MRSLIVLLFLIIFFILTLPIYLIITIVGKSSKESKDRLSQKIIRIVCRIILFLSGVKLTVVGLENIPDDDSVLFVSNHRSVFDIVVAYATITKQMSFIAKQELAKVPLINTWLKLLNCLLIDRNDLRQTLTVILEAIQMVKDGYSIFLFPEGTRSRNKEMIPFKEGSFKISHKSGCPVIPVSINNTDNAFENQIPRIKSTHVIIEFDKPVYPKELDKEDSKLLGRYIQNIIEKNLDKNEAMLEFETI